MRKVLVLEPFCEEHMERIREAAGETFLVEQLPLDRDEEVYRKALYEAEIVIGQPAMELLQDVDANCPKLKLIQMSWAGTDMYTRNKLPFPKDRILLANARGTYGIQISQFIIAQILTLMLNFKEYHFQQKESIWKKRGPIASLDHAKVLIYGAGDIGTMTAKRLQGFDAYTIGVCRNASGNRPYFNELCTLDEAERYLPEADVVICCIPNSDATQGYFSKERLMAMKQDAILINVGRGNFIDCMALDEVLIGGRLWGAALDVTDPEPLPEGHPLWQNPKCFITPHASGGVFDQLKKTQDLLCDIVCDNIRRIGAGLPVKNRIF